MGPNNFNSKPPVSSLHRSEIQSSEAQVKGNQQSHISSVLWSCHLQRYDIGDTLCGVDDRECSGDGWRQGGQSIMGHGDIFFALDRNERRHLRFGVRLVCGCLD